MKAISVDHFASPIGGYGFRRGNWTVTLEDGTKDRIYLSIPHALPLPEQSERVLEAYNKRQGAAL